MENKWTAALDCLLASRRLIKVPSEGERFYPPSRGNETPPRAGGEVTGEEKKTADEKKNERIYMWKPDRANESTPNTADNGSLPGFETRGFYSCHSCQVGFQLDMLHAVHSVPTPPRRGLSDLGDALCMPAYTASDEWRRILFLFAFFFFLVKE